MSKLDKLIKRLCPDGVEWEELGRLGNFFSGLNGKSKKDFENGNEKFITYKNVFSNLELDINAEDKVFISKNEKQNLLLYGDVIFTGSSEIKNECGMSSVLTKQTFEKLFLNSFCFGFRFHDGNIMLPGFSKYLFRSSFIRKQIIKTSNGVTRFNVSKEKIKQIKIPIPPLEVQKEIVHILDLFTELTARREQYEYYRDKLLTFGDDVEWDIFGNISTVSDYVANGSFASLRENVNYKYHMDYAVLLRTVDYSNGFDREKFIYINKHAYDFLSKSKLYGGEIIINNIGAGVGTTFICPDLEIPMSLAPNAIVVKTPNNKFYYYWLQSKFGQNAIKKIVSKGSMPKFNKTDFKMIKIPIPPLEEQERIVSILDKFDKLCNDLTEGLPAEIEARKKQYEYYRDKLLTFKEK